MHKDICCLFEESQAISVPLVSSFRALHKRTRNCSVGVEYGFFSQELSQEVLKPAALRKGAAVGEPLRDNMLSSLEFFSPVQLNFASCFHLLNCCGCGRENSCAGIVHPFTQDL